MKGGARPGAGRKKGQVDKKPRAGTEKRAEYDQIQKMLAMGIKAKALFYQEFLVRVANQDKKQKPLSLAEKKLMAQLAVELAEQIGEGKQETSTDILDAEEFLKKVWNDQNVDMALRIRAAEVVHKEGKGPKGKKEDLVDKANEASKGKFASMANRIRRVK